MINYNDLIQQSLKDDDERGLDFTTDWFHGGIKYDFDQNVKINKQQKLRILEIGAFEGKSSVWIAETYLNHPESTMTIIDPFLSSDVTTDVTNDTEKRFMSNIGKCKYATKCFFIKGKSQDILPQFIIKGNKFDLIFIDGSHLSRDIIIDLTLSWNMLLPGGYLVMDDYNNKNSAVKKCLDFWTSCLEPHEWKIVFDRYQVICIKLR